MANTWTSDVSLDSPPVGDEAAVGSVTATLKDEDGNVLYTKTQRMKCDEASVADFVARAKAEYDAKSAITTAEQTLATEITTALNA